MSFKQSVKKEHYTVSKRVTVEGDKVREFITKKVVPLFEKDETAFTCDLAHNKLCCFQHKFNFTHSSLGLLTIMLRTERVWIVLSIFFVLVPPTANYDGFYMFFFFLKGRVVWEHQISLVLRVSRQNEVKPMLHLQLLTKQHVLNVFETERCLYMLLL